MEFDYFRAFQRNIGLLTREEQEATRNFKLAIPGMGSIGGANFIALVREGFTNFNIADFDTFSIENINRQYGAKTQTLGEEKTKVMKREARKINPQINVKIYPDGINENNLDSFLHGVDLVVDGLDFFAVDIRRRLFNRALEMNIPVLSAGAIGYGCAGVIFLPGGPDFDDYFNVSDNMTKLEKTIRFGLGLAPSMLQRTYMRNVNIKKKKAPASIVGVNLCSSFVSMNTIKILFGMKVFPVPYYHQIDLMRNKFVIRKVFLGKYNPLHRIFVRYALKKMQE